MRTRVTLEEQVQPAVEPLGAQLTLGEGETLVGDLGLIVLKALLENGVGYLITGWRDAQNPVDAAIDSARRTVLSRRGVLLRRLRRFEHVADTIRDPGVSAAGSTAPMRGAVIWNGRSGVAPALDRFVQLEPRGSVVGICFDPAAASIASGAVIDPEQTPAGIVGAIDAAFALAASTGSPVLVLLRPRALDMRGSMTCRDNLDVAAADALDRAVPRCLDRAESCSTLAIGGVTRLGSGDVEHVVVSGAPIAAAVRHALNEIVRALVDAGANAEAARVRDTALVEVVVPTCLPLEARELIADAPHVSVIADDSARLSTLVESMRPAQRPVRVSRISYASVGVAHLVRALAADLRATLGLDAQHVAAVTLDALASPAAVDGRLGRVIERMPRRGASMHRAIPREVSAALVLAQAAIGVPDKIPGATASWRSSSGSTLTVVAADRFARLGAGCAADVAQRGVYVVFGGVSPGVASAAAGMGATVEVVNGSSPRDVAQAIAHGCAAPDIVPRVIVLAAGASVAIPTDLRLATDPELVGEDRLALAGIPESALELVERAGDARASGPVVELRDEREARAGVAAARQLSPGWFDVRVAPVSNVVERVMLAIRRHTLKTIGGLES